MSFEKDFFWGAATASHQVEGGCVNDWSRWEVSKKRMDDLELRGEIAQHGRSNFISGEGVDHYHRYKEDIALAKSLGMNMLRVSLEWSRIEPEEGKFSAEALAHYLDVVRTMRATSVATDVAGQRGIEPMITLWHWPLPLWLADRGGWESAEVVAAFERFTAKVVDAIGPDVTYWITLNEPEIYASQSYLDGTWPPQKKNPIAFLSVMTHLVQAHRRAFRVIKSHQPNAQIGIAKNNIWFEAVNGSLWNRVLASIASFFWNDLLLWLTQSTTDFVGMNHYFHNRIDGWFNKNKNERVSDLGWELYPEALYHVVLDAKKFGKPIIITENGLADAEDAQRAWFLEESIRWLEKAKDDGADVRGYLHWSLLDNFEWAFGYWPQFGLIHVDRKTMERTIRPSARKYQEMIQK